MKNQDLAHRFANGAISGKANSTKIIGDCYYSYNTVIAIRMDNIFILDTLKYSVTTSKHQSELRSAITTREVRVNNNLDSLKYLVNDKDLFWSELNKLLIKDLDKNYKDFEDKPNKTNFEDLRKSSCYNDYVAQLQPFRDHIDSLNWDKFHTYRVKTEANRIKREETRQKNLLKTDQEKLNDWLNFKFNGRLHNLELAKIRIKGEIVETTQGATVSLLDAILLADRVKNQLPINDHKIGNYTVNYKVDNYLKIGCHKIDIAQALSIIDAYVNE